MQPLQFVTDAYIVLIYRYADDSFFLLIYACGQTLNIHVEKTLLEYVSYSLT